MQDTQRHLWRLLWAPAADSQAFSIGGNFSTWLKKIELPRSILWHSKMLSGCPHLRIRPPWFLFLESNEWTNTEGGIYTLLALLKPQLELSSMVTDGWPPLTGRAPACKTHQKGQVLILTSFMAIQEETFLVVEFSFLLFGRKYGKSLPSCRICRLTWRERCKPVGKAWKHTFFLLAPTSTNTNAVSFTRNK